MRAGFLRHTITIQTPTLVADGMGGQTTTWGTLVTTRASINAVKLQETPDSDRMFARGTFMFRMRFDSSKTITHDCRILFGTRTFEIRTIENMAERNIYLDITADELDIK